MKEVAPIRYPNHPILSEASSQEAKPNGECLKNKAPAEGRAHARDGLDGTEWKGADWTGRIAKDGRDWTGRTGWDGLDGNII